MCKNILADFAPNSKITPQIGGQYQVAAFYAGPSRPLIYCDAIILRASGAVAGRIRRDARGPYVQAAQDENGAWVPALDGWERTIICAVNWDSAPVEVAA